MRWNTLGVSDIGNFPLNLAHNQSTFLMCKNTLWRCNGLLNNKEPLHFGIIRVRNFEFWLNGCGICHALAPYDWSTVLSFNEYSRKCAFIYVCLCLYQYMKVEGCVLCMWDHLVVNWAALTHLRGLALNCRITLVILLIKYDVSHYINSIRMGVLINHGPLRVWINCRTWPRTVVSIIYWVRSINMTRWSDLCYDLMMGWYTQHKISSPYILNVVNRSYTHERRRRSLVGTWNFDTTRK